MLPCGLLGGPQQVDSFPRAPCPKQVEGVCTLQFKQPRVGWTELGVGQRSRIRLLGQCEAFANSRISVSTFERAAVAPNLAGWPAPSRLTAMS